MSDKNLIINLQRQLERGLINKYGFWSKVLYHWWGKDVPITVQMTVLKLSGRYNPVSYEWKMGEDDNE